MKPYVELTLCTGQTGHKMHSVMLAIEQDLMRELMEPLQLSDEPYQLMMASPIMWGGRGNAVQQRRRIFKLREDHAKHLANQITVQLIKMFGSHDKNG